MMPSGKMMVVWSVLILGPVIAEYAKCAASTVTPRTPSASAKLGRGGGSGAAAVAGESNQTRSAQPSEISPAPREFAAVGERRGISVDFDRYGIRPRGTKSLATNEESPKSDRGDSGASGTCPVMSVARVSSPWFLGGRRPKAMLNSRGVEAARITHHQAPVEQNRVPGQR